jgi:hypothetical protein
MSESQGSPVFLFVTVLMFQLLEPTGMRYLVAVDVRSRMVHGKCWHCLNVSPAQAAMLMTLSLVKAERDVTVMAFGAEGTMQPVELDENISIQETQNKLKEVWKSCTRVILGLRHHANKICTLLDFMQHRLVILYTS